MEAMAVPSVASLGATQEDGYQEKGALRGSGGDSRGLQAVAVNRLSWKCVSDFNSWCGS